METVAVYCETECAAGGAVHLRGQTATVVLLSGVVTCHYTVINDCKMM
jgi:hypothetical protein